MPASSPKRPRRGGAVNLRLPAAIAAVGALLLAGCGSAKPGKELGSGKLRVVAAEGFWGSIAQQLGGEEAQVSSVIVNPATDPHSYEPTAADARTMAVAQMAIVNGIGYDEWAGRLLDANPLDGRVVLDVGKRLGLKAGDNPHQWYSPAGVRTAIDQIVADYDKLRPGEASYFAQRKKAFETVGLARYDALMKEIRARYAGVRVGYSESIFQPLGVALGLTLATPYSFAKAIAEGSEVSAQDKLTVNRQVSKREIKLWVFNSQNVTPDVQRVNALAREAHIPTVTITETQSPASDSFEQWQVAQLERLRKVLSQVTGR